MEFDVNNDAVNFLHTLKIKNRKVYLDNFEIKGLNSISISKEAEDYFPLVTFKVYVQNGFNLLKIS